MTFEHVSFRYSRTGVQDPRRPSDLVVAAGTKDGDRSAQTGSGKTRRSATSSRWLYDAQRGADASAIDGSDRASTIVFASLARNVGLVSQETYPLQASIADNPLLARPRGDLTRL